MGIFGDIVAGIVHNIDDPVVGTAHDVIVKSGKCGDVSWKFEDGALIISGTGRMEKPKGSSMSWSVFPIKESIIKEGVTEIGEAAFSNCSMKELTIPTSVTNIGRGAFFRCYGLEELIIPANVMIIEEGAFLECSNLKKIKILASITSIAYGAFKKCTSLTKVHIPEGVTEIGVDAFWGCSSLESITIPDSVTSIGSGAFYCCKNLKKIRIPDSVEYISYHTFNSCESLTEIKIPNGVIFIGGYAFLGCESLKEIKLSDSIIQIGDSAFSGCKSLTKLTIPANVTTIGKSTFSWCNNLTKIIILGCIISIGDDAFEECKNLNSIYYKANVDFPANVKEILNKAATLVPCYKLIVSDDIKILSEPAFVDGDSKFYSSKVKLEDIFGVITDVEISEGIFGNFILTPDGNDTFIIDVTFGSGILSWKVEGDTLIVGNVYEIENFSSKLSWGNFIDIIKKIVIVNGVEKIVAHAFADCPNVEEIVLPASVTSIGDCAFSISFCGNNAVNDGKNVFWCLEEGILVIKKNPAVKDVDADFSMGDVSWEAARKNIRGFKIENGIVLSKTFFDWFIQRDKTMKLSAD